MHEWAAKMALPVPEPDPAQTQPVKSYQAWSFSAFRPLPDGKNPYSQHGPHKTSGQGIAAVNPYCVPNPAFHEDSQLNKSNEGREANAEELQKRMVAVLTTGFDDLHFPVAPNVLQSIVDRTFQGMGLPPPTLVIRLDRPGAVFSPLKWDLIVGFKDIHNLGTLLERLVHECTHAIDAFLTAAYLTAQGTPPADCAPQILEVAKKHPYSDKDGRIRRQIEARKQNYSEVISNRDRAEEVVNKAYERVKMEVASGEIVTPESASYQAAAAAIQARDVAKIVYEEHPVEAPAFAATAGLGTSCVIPYRRLKQH